MWVKISKIKQGFARNEYKATKPYFKSVYWTVQITNHLFPDSIYSHEDGLCNELRYVVFVWKFVQKIILLRSDNLRVLSNANGKSRYCLPLPEYEEGAVNSDVISLT